MKLKRLKLINVQKHAEIELFFNDGVNIIHGPTDTGKSCCLRGIKWVLLNEGKTRDIRKENTKETKAELEFDIDLTLTRIVSDSVNRYVVDYHGEQKQYDNFGRSVPEEIKTILQMHEIVVGDVTLIPNVADQIAMPFLVNESDITKAKIFNNLTGTDISDKIIEDINKNIYSKQRQLKLIKDTIQEDVDKLEALTKQKELSDSKYNTINNKYIELDKNINTLNEYEETYNKYTSYSEEINNLIEKKETILCYDGNVIDALKNKITKLSDYIKYDNMYFEVNNNIDGVNIKLKKLKIFVMDKVSKLAETYWKLYELCTGLNHNESDEAKLKKKLEDVNSKKQEYIIKYKKYLKESKVCPTCQSQINDDVLNNMEL